MVRDLKRVGVASGIDTVSSRKENDGLQIWNKIYYFIIIFLFLILIFLHVHKSERGEGIQTNNFRFMRRGLQPIKLSLEDNKIFFISNKMKSINLL
jgi:hypothetical protein